MKKMFIEADKMQTHMLVDEENAKLFVEMGVITERQLQESRERLKEDSSHGDDGQTKT